MDNIMTVKERFEKLYPQQAQAFKNAKNDDEILLLKDQFVGEAINRLLAEIEKANLKDTINPSILKDTNETVAVILTEKKYQDLINARGRAIETELVKLFDGVERLKELGTHDTEAIVYGLTTFGLGALGFVMSVDLVNNILVGLGLSEAIFTTLTTLGATIINIVVDIVVLSIIPLIYFMVKPAACNFVIINDLGVDLVIEAEKVVHGKVNVKTREIPARSKMSKIVRSGGIWSTQKRDAALYGSQYGVVLKQEKGQFGEDEPDNTRFAIAVECPLADGKNSCAVGINKTVDEISDEVDTHRKQDVSASNGTYGIEMRCNSGSGSLAYYVCRIFREG